MIKALTPETHLGTKIHMAAINPLIPENVGRITWTLKTEQDQTLIDNMDIETATRPGGDNLDTSTEASKKASAVGPGHGGNPINPSANPNPQRKQSVVKHGPQSHLVRGWVHQNFKP